MGDRRRYDDYSRTRPEDRHEAARRAARAEQEARVVRDPNPRRVDDMMDVRDQGMGRRMVEPAYGNVRDARPDPRGVDPRLIDARVDPRIDQRYARDPRFDDMDMDPPMPRVAGRQIYEQDRPRNQDVRMGNDDGYYTTTRPGYEPPIMSPPVGARQPPYRELRDEPPPRTRRDIIDFEAPQARGASEKYNEYFLPKEGISHEVIQTEISRFLGNDATVKRHRMQDGRDGYAIRAYRAPTTAMIQSLKEKTNDYERDQASRQRAGRDPEHYDDWVSTRESGRDRADRHASYRNDRPDRNEMDVDEDEFDSQPRSAGYGRIREDREPPPARPVQQPGRHQPAVTTGYPQDSQYYAVGSNQIPGDQFDQSRQPRSLLPPVGTPPPTQAARPAQPGYGQTGYPANTPAPRVSVPGTYADTRAYTARDDTRTGRGRHT